MSQHSAHPGSAGPRRADAGPDPKGPRIVVFSLLFPRNGQPQAGLFVRERMYRVARELPLAVVSPVPWFPFQGLLRRLRPHFRPPAPRHERQGEVDIYMPRFFSVPGLLKRWDGILLALACLLPMIRLRRRFNFDVIDAHFAYPDGYAAVLLGRWLDVPVTITLRGTETRLCASPAFRPLVQRAVRRAAHVFTVSRSLRDLALSLGAEPGRVTVVPNGVDTERFSLLDRSEARRQLDLPPEAPILISVGTLVERKGFHRVIEILPELRGHFPGLLYLIVGGAGPEGDWSARLRAMSRERGVQDAVRFLGHVAPDELRVPLSAANVFVLATRNEGWANVFLEAMACGLPVVTTDRGGNKEVVSNDALGSVVPFGDSDALFSGLRAALGRDWDRQSLRRFAEANAWDDRVARLTRVFRELRASASQ